MIWQYRPRVCVYVDMSFVLSRLERCGDLREGWLLAVMYLAYMRKSFSERHFDGGAVLLYILVFVNS